MTQTIHTSLTFAPLLPDAALIGLAGVAVAVVAFSALRRARGTGWRAATLAVLLVLLLNPQLAQETRVPVPDIAFVVIDDSLSQTLGERPAQTAAAVEALSRRLDALAQGSAAPLEVRTLSVGQGEERERGTRLFSALERASGDVAVDRIAGAIVVTDGQVHDAPESLPYPVHVLLTGQPGETDRRVEVVAAPAYGLVGETARVQVRVDDDSLPPGASLTLTLHRGEGEAEQRTLPVGETVSIALPLQRAGANVLELSVAAREGEPTLLNNRTAVAVNGVRDRLRVLLISGEPHVGERAWRSLLKADANVDLVHFTILRPPTKDDGTPLNELALIVFPMQELFEERLNDFDLIIFDRYSRRGIVPLGFLSNVAAYVRRGGAVLVSAGPEYGQSFSLFDSPLGTVLPTPPTGSQHTTPFVPALSPHGQRHPVTSTLGGETETWGPWLRVVGAARTSGTTLLETPEGRPLLVVDRVEQGRVAVLLSDTTWLWQRGWQGGGPQDELIRRLVHWMMGEPELEESALSARLESGTLTVERRSLDDLPAEGLDIALTRPGEGEGEGEGGGGGEASQPLRLHPAGPGLGRGMAEAAAPGVYRLEDPTTGQRLTVAAGAPDPLELRVVTATSEILAPLARASGGAVVWLAERGVPPLRRTEAEALRHHGTGWLGLRQASPPLVSGLSHSPVIPTGLALVLVLAGLMMTWWREGGR